MKISFSTIGTPDFDWVDIYSMAKDLSFDGIEIRGIGDEISAVNAKVFSPAKIDATIKKLKELRLEIPCLDTGCVLKEEENRDLCIKEVTDYIELADKLKTPYIRILADRDPEPVTDVDDEYVAGVLRELAAIAEKYDNVTLLVETNGVYSDTLRLKRLIEKVGSARVAVLWDIHHPYRYMEESPEETVKNIGSYIKHVHVKDSLMVDGKPKYKLMGQGDMPLKSIFASLAEIGYSGYASLEWVKRWDMGLQNAAIAFPHFAHYMTEYRQEKQELLQDNKAHTGKYVWPKDQLIDYTFPDVLDRMCKEFPDQYAFRYTELDYTRTYIEFRNDVDTFARSLIAMGVRRGDHVAIWATNVPQWYITFWATTKIGAVLVTVNTAYRVHEIEYLLRQSDTHTLVMIEKYKDIDYVEIINELCPELKDSKPGSLNSERLPVLRNIVVAGEKHDGCYTWEEAIALSDTVSQKEVEFRRKFITKHDVCNMQYTSGTTGFPKGVMLTHYNVVNNGKSIGDGMDLSTADKMMIQVPMFHCFGMVLAMTASMTHGTTMCPITAFSPRQGIPRSSYHVHSNAGT